MSKPNSTCEGCGRTCRPGRGSCTKCLPRPSLRWALESVAETMGATVDWSRGDARRFFGGSERDHGSSVEMEARIHTEMTSMEIRIQVRVTFRQRSIDDAVGAVEYAAHATEAAALAVTIEGETGAMRWSWEEHQALYASLREGDV